MKIHFDSIHGEPYLRIDFGDRSGVDYYEKEIHLWPRKYIFPDMGRQIVLKIKDKDDYRQIGFRSEYYCCLL